MDWLLEIKQSLEQEVLHQVANLLDLDVDLLFLDITSTYFELDEPVTPVARDQRGVPVPDAEHGHGDRAGDKDTRHGRVSHLWQVPTTTAMTCRRS